jgi:type IX secretion system PorP/SprF family membrane protein
VREIEFIRFSVLVVCIFLTGRAGMAQDIHFSQFANTPLTVNPGLAGIYGGDIRFVANVRDQWRNVRVPYTTFSGTVERKFYNRRQQYDRYFTGGLLLNYDRQGSLKLTTVRIGLPVSYITPLAEKHYLSVGVMPVFGQRSFSFANLTTDAQWTGSFFDPSAPTMEMLQTSGNRLSYLDLNAGLNYRYQGIENRTKLDAGIAFHHFNRPGFDFWETGEDIRLNMRTAVYLMGAVQIIEEVDAVGQIVYQRQGGYQQALWGIGGRLHLNRQPYKEFALQAGVNYRSRFNDAIIPHFEAHWKTWVLGFSYDINISQFKVATERRGGPELSLIYRLYRVKPMPFKSCPII